uniref:Late embryogenesis abundant protein LEA-2 subgroup domain-containing protein n=1 Tax=Romanomermis culicivorax TaxID=13658 RepID=A0A915HSJ8_ROMCU
MASIIGKKVDDPGSPKFAKQFKKKLIKKAKSSPTPMTGAISTISQNNTTVSVPTQRASDSSRLGADSQASVMGGGGGVSFFSLLVGPRKQMNDVKRDSKITGTAVVKAVEEGNRARAKMKRLCKIGCYLFAVFVALSLIGLVVLLIVLRRAASTAIFEEEGDEVEVNVNLTDGLLKNKTKVDVKLQLISPPRDQQFYEVPVNGIRPIGGLINLTLRTHTNNNSFHLYGPDDGISLLTKKKPIKSLFDRDGENFNIVFRFYENHIVSNKTHLINRQYLEGTSQKLRAIHLEGDVKNISNIKANKISEAEDLDRCQ